MKTTMNTNVLVGAACLAFAALTASAAEPWGKAYSNGEEVQTLDTRSATDGAVLTNGQLTAGVDEIRFIGAEIKVDHLDLTNLTVRIVGDSAGTVLKPDAGRADPEFGGALYAVGGAVTITNVVFDGFSAETAGGAVALQEMTGDCAIEGCTFTNCTASAEAGVGGAVYASAASGTAAMLSVRASAFVGCSAVNGGAIATERIYPYDEKAIAIDIDASEFLRNAASYIGGALWVEGDTMFTDTLFEENFAYDAGGAVCVGSDDVSYEGATVRSLAGTVFRGNFVHDETEGHDAEANGGAITLANAGIGLYVDRTAFEANTADLAGGAISDIGGNEIVLSTCVFSNNVLTLDEAFGGAVYAQSGLLAMTNVTVRGSNRNAIDVYETDAELVNCVVIDNDGSDISSTADGDTPFLTALRSAFGSLAADPAVVTVTTNECLVGRTAADYSGDSLHLREGEPYNPVAVEGLVQTATDFDGVAYGSKPYGYSMGAFECPAVSGISGLSVTNLYDGVGHSNEFYSASEAIPVTWTYATTKDGPYVPAIPVYTNSGEYTTYAIADLNGSPVTNVQYVVITNRIIKLESAGATKTYDGDPLTTNDVWVVGTGDHALADGDTLNYFKCTGSQTNVGTNDNTIAENYSITNALGETVTGNYTVEEKKLGKLIVETAALPDPEDDDPKKDPKAGPFPGPNLPEPTVPPVQTNNTDGSWSKLSDYDWIGVYDGEAHTFDVTALSNKLDSLAEELHGNPYTISYSLTGKDDWQSKPFYSTDVEETPTSFWYRVEVPNYTNYIHAAGVIITQRVVHIEFPEVKKAFDGTDDCPPPGYVSTNLTTEAENMVAGEEIDAEGRGHFDSPYVDATAFILTNVTLAAGSGTKLSNYRIFVGANGGLEFPTDGEDEGPTSYDPEDPRWPEDPDNPGQPGEPKCPARITAAPLSVTAESITASYSGATNRIAEVITDAKSGEPVTPTAISNSVDGVTWYLKEDFPFYVDVTDGAAPVWVAVVADNHETFVSDGPLAYVTITQKVVAVTLKDQTKTYGDKTAAWKVKDVEGLVGDDQLTGNPGKIVGKEPKNASDTPYSVTVGTGTLSAGGNYTIVVNKAKITITKGEVGPADDVVLPGGNTPEKIEEYMEGVPAGTLVAFRTEVWTNDVPEVTTVGTNIVARFKGVTDEDAETAEFEWSTTGEQGPWSVIEPHFTEICATQVWCRVICPNYVTTNVFSYVYIKSRGSKPDDEEAEEEDKLQPNPETEEQTKKVVEDIAANDNRDSGYDPTKPAWDGKGEWEGGAHGVQTDAEVNLKVTSVVNLPADEKKNAEDHLADEIKKAKKIEGIDPTSVKGRNVDVKLLYTRTYADGTKSEPENIGGDNTKIIPFTIAVSLEEDEEILKVTRYHEDEEMPLVSPERYELSDDRTLLTVYAKTYSEFILITGKKAVSPIPDCPCGEKCCSFGYRLKILVRTTAAETVSDASTCSDGCYRKPSLRRFIGLVYGATGTGECCDCNAWNHALLALWDYDTKAAVTLDDKKSALVLLDRVGYQDRSKCEMGLTLAPKQSCGSEKVSGSLVLSGYGSVGNHQGNVTVGGIAGYCAGLLPSFCTGKDKDCRDTCAPSSAWDLCTKRTIRPGVTAAYGKWMMVWDASAAAQVGAGKALPARGGKVTLSGGWAEATTVDIGFGK